MDKIWKYGGAVALVLLTVALIYAFGELVKLAANDMPASASALTLVSIGGVIVLLLVLTIVAVIFGFLDLTDKGQAMGLPEGSIRAVIALSLVVLFAILAVFLYQGVSVGGPQSTIENLSDADRAQFIKEHSTARDLQTVLVRDKDGQPLKNTDGTPKNLYTITYRSPNPTGDDFAKQLLVLLGTLVTSVTSFYLGARTATSAAAAATQMTDVAKPTVTGINPNTHSIGNDGAVIHLQIMGNNLNIITHVMIRRAGVQILGTGVTSNPTLVICQIPVSAAATPPGPPPWDVVVDDGASKSASLPAALTITT